MRNLPEASSVSFELAFNEYYASFSPDGRWIAYSSDESGSVQLYVQNFPPSGKRWEVSTGRTGVYPRWRPDGKELFYDDAGPMMAVDSTGTSSMKITEEVKGAMDQKSVEFLKAGADIYIKQ